MHVHCHEHPILGGSFGQKANENMLTPTTPVQNLLQMAQPQTTKGSGIPYIDIAFVALRADIIFRKSIDMVTIQLGGA